MALLARLRRARKRRRELVCQEAVELMTEYLEGAMSPRDKARFEAHLAGCDACNAYLDQMRLTIATLGRLEPDSLPEPVLNELVGLLRQHRAR